MDLDGSKRFCGICKNWAGPRQFVDGVSRVKPSARGQCQLPGKIKPPHGGCDQWIRWDGADMDE